jgi:hypothetical protein
VMLEGARRHRESFAWALVGFVAVNVLMELFGLFGGQGFTTNAMVNHLEFVSPVVAGGLALAVWLVASGPEPTVHARAVVATALGVAGAALLLGVVAWLGGLTVNSVLQGTGQKVLNSFLFLAGAGLLGCVGWFGWLVYERLPAPARRQPQWPGPGSERQYGQPQYGQPQYGPSQWASPHPARADHARWAPPAADTEPTQGLSIFGDPPGEPVEESDPVDMERDDAGSPAHKTRVDPADPGRRGSPPRPS